MVNKYDPTTKKMVIVSIPRDTMVDIPGYGMNKINATYAYGGEELTDQVIENLLDIKLDFSIKLNFDTFSNIIDTLGGVRVNAKKQYFDSDNTLVVDQGSQLLTGKQALFYVRFRKDSDNDYGRIERQQEVIISLVEYLKTTSLQQKVKLITKYYNQGIQTNASLTKITDYIKMSSQDKEITYENYRLQTHGELIDGLWYELYNQEDLDFIKSLFTNKEEMNLENWK
jgi:LCP family protein required for cell wall assembly